MDQYQYIDFVNKTYGDALKLLEEALTPTNPIQDLLDQQVNAYKQTGELMGAAILQVIENARDTLSIVKAAEELIEKSNQFIKANQQKELVQRQRLERTRQQRTTALTIGLIIALILSLVSFFLYRESNRNLLEAINQTRRAQSGQFGTIAVNKLESDFNLALLLSVESIRKDDNFLARDSLMTAIQYNPNLLRSLETHTAWVNSVAFSPDGKTLASGSGDETIRLWDVETGQQIREALTGNTAGVTSVAFSPDGKTLASGGLTIRLWDVEMGQQIGEALTGHEYAVNSVAFSPDGKTLASSGGLTIRLWDVETGQQIGEALTGHTAGVSSVAFSPDGKTLASGSGDETIRLWDVEMGQQIGEALTGHTA
ncbi:MAG: WD40 repeat domain-containing protein, partial [Chloroflexi bacterium]|nr:WD40 repeat domain-containing protein [Chloroflexota bacterium]